MQATAKERRLDERHILRLERTYGIPRDFAEAAGLFSANSPDEVARYTGSKPPEGGGIVIPYGGGYYRVRLDVTYVDKDGDTVKYLAPAGRGNHLYVPPGTDIAASTVVITEGEFKALCAAARGINCVALPGIDSWRQRSPVGEKLPADEALLVELHRDWSGQTVVLIYDSDITVNHPRWAAYPELAEELYRLGASEVKIITLPRLETVDGKTGLDDYLLSYERAGQDGVARFWSLVEHAPAWLPTGAGAERFALRELASADVERQVRGAAALIGRFDEMIARAKLKAWGVKNLRSLWKEAKKYLAAAQERQAPKPAKPKDRSGSQSQQGQQGGSTGQGQQQPRTIAAAFPPAAEVIPADFPFPDTGRDNTWYDIRNGIVVKVVKDTDDHGREHENVYTIVDTVFLLTQRVNPLEQGCGVQKWRVAWWERDGWQFRDLPARFLFDRKRVGELVDAGVPVSSESIGSLVAWLDDLRRLAVLGHQNAPELPTVHAVGRCGWHALEEKRFFVYGNEIIRPDGTAAAEAGDRDEIEADNGSRTDADIRWAQDLSDLEQQVLNAFRVGGDPEVHKRFLLETAVKYPQVAFSLGCAAGTPLLRFARDAGLIDVDGFTVLMVPRAGGRSSSQGKSTWNAVTASLYGWPGTRPGEGLLRDADSTKAGRAVVSSTSCDLPTFREDLHRLAEDKNARAVLVELIHQVSGGSDRDRAARAGGGRRTRGYHTVLFGTAELDITRKLPTECGAHGRVMKLPPLLEEIADENAAEAERLLETALTHYGHAGRAYLNWLVRKINAEGVGFIVEAVKAARDDLRTSLPTDERRHVAWRLASRAAVGYAGLALLLEALGADEETQHGCLQAFERGWQMVVDGIPAETVAGRALEAVQAYVAMNAEAIERLRSDEERPPQKWVGALSEITDPATGEKRKVVALLETAFAEAVSREPYALDPDHALQALIAAGYVIPYKEKRGEKTITRSKNRVTVGNAKPWCVCIPVELLGIDANKILATSSEGKASDAGEPDDGEKVPL